MRGVGLTLASIAGAVLGWAPHPAHAQTPAEFYKGKQLHLVLGNASGGDYELGARLLIKYMSGHLPGNPAILVQNMPGAASVTAANFLFNKAPKDGTYFGSFSRNIANQGAMGVKNLEADPRQFGWIGASSLPSRVCVVKATSAVKTPRDLLTQELIVAGSGAGSSLSIVPTALNKILGMRFKIVEGYQGTSAALIALERGEVDGLCHTYSLFQTTDARLLRDGTLRVLMHVEETPLPDDPDVPSVFGLVKDERQKQLLRFVFSSVEFGRPYAAPPGVPEDRLAALRHAFADTLRDPALIGDAKKAGLDMTYRSPNELEGLVRELYATPPEVIAQVEKIVPASGLR